MARIALKQVIGRQQEARALVDTLAGALGVPVSIEDLEGRVLQGDARAPTARRGFPCSTTISRSGGCPGRRSAGAVASLLDHLVAREVERKALGAEVLHLYREINLIYSFSEKLAALLDVERVAELTLQEARHLIVATDGTILLLDEDIGRADVGGQLRRGDAARCRSSAAAAASSARWPRPASPRSSTTSRTTRAARCATRRSAR